MHLVTAKSLENLKLGREKGTNHLTGISKSKSHREKTKRTMSEWCKNNPDKVKARGAKNRAENHYLWKGGISNLNQSIRQMNEYRNWQRKMKRRDKECICGSTKELESHHLIPLKLLIEIHKIKTRDDARNCKELWSMKNGITLCRKCHYKTDNRKYNDND